MKQLLLVVSTALCLCLSFSPAAAPASARVAKTPLTGVQHAPSDYGFGEDWCNG
jgi:hypothetical protein